jgi:hypothetical protein
MKPLKSTQALRQSDTAFARLTALQQARALRWLEREAGIPEAFFDTRPAVTIINHNDGKAA